MLNLLYLYIVNIPQFLILPEPEANFEVIILIVFSLLAQLIVIS